MSWEFLLLLLFNQWAYGNCYKAPVYIHINQLMHILTAQLSFIHTYICTNIFMHNIVPTAVHLPVLCICFVSVFLVKLLSHFSVVGCRLWRMPGTLSFKSMFLPLSYTFQLIGLLFGCFIGWATNWLNCTCHSIFRLICDFCCCCTHTHTRNQLLTGRVCALDNECDVPFYFPILHTCRAAIIMPSLKM